MTSKNKNWEDYDDSCSDEDEESGAPKNET